MLLSMANDLLAFDPELASDEELSRWLVSCDKLRARLDALECSVLAHFDARQTYAGDGAATAGAWLRNATGAAGSSAREKVRVSVRLRAMPGTAEAFADGSVCYPKVRLLAAARTNRTEAAFARDEAMLVEAAKRFGVEDLAKVLAYWKAAADPDGVSAGTAAQWTRRSASLVKGIDGTWNLAGILDPESGTVLKGVWDAIADELWESDRRDAEIDPAAPVRTSAQRRVDSLVEMARRAGACDIATARRNRAEMIVLVDHDTLLERAGGAAELADGTIITGEDVRRLACDAACVRAVTLGGSEILDLGRSTPVPSAAQRRALLLRDGGCVWPGCDRPGNWCDAHHCHPYRRGSDHGGRTDLDDLVLLCATHHHKIHREDFTVARDPATHELVFRRADGTVIAGRPRAGPLTRRRAGGRSGDPDRYRGHRKRIDHDTHLARQRAAALAGTGTSS